MPRDKNCLPTVSRTIFDSQLPSPKLSHRMPPKLSLPHKRGLFSSFKVTPAVRVFARQIERQKSVSRQVLPRDIRMSVLAHWEVSLLLTEILTRIIHRPTSNLKCWGFGDLGTIDTEIKTKRNTIISKSIYLQNYESESKMRGEVSM